MIGNWLRTLTPEQEGRVLSGRMAGYWSTGPRGVSRCLVVTARGDGVTEREVCHMAEYAAPLASYRWLRGMDFTGQNGHAPHIPAQYDILCQRFGCARVNAAIRDRISRNQLRRTLSPSFSGSLEGATP